MIQENVADGPARVELITVFGMPVEVPMPRDWVVVQAPPSVPFAARQRLGTRFLANVNVTVDGDQQTLHPFEAGALLAAELPGGTLLCAQSAPLGGNLMAVVHAATDCDVVTVQRQLPVSSATVAVSYTCSVEQFPVWGDAFQQFGQEVCNSRAKGEAPPL